MAEGLSDFISVVKTEEVLVEVFIELIEDGVGGSQFENDEGMRNRLWISRAFLYCWSSSLGGVGKIEVC